MHIHHARPACYRTEEPEDIGHVWRDAGRWCYQTAEQARTHDAGCFGCRRFLEERAAVDSLAKLKERIQGLCDRAAGELGL